MTVQLNRVTLVFGLTGEPLVTFAAAEELPGGVLVGLGTMPVVINAASTFTTPLGTTITGDQLVGAIEAFFQTAWANRPGA